MYDSYKMFDGHEPRVLSGPAATSAVAETSAVHVMAQAKLTSFYIAQFSKSRNHFLDL